MKFGKIKSPPHLSEPLCFSNNALLCAPVPHPTKLADTSARLCLRVERACVQFPEAENEMQDLKVDAALDENKEVESYYFDFRDYCKMSN